MYDQVKRPAKANNGPRHRLDCSDKLAPMRPAMGNFYGGLQSKPVVQRKLTVDKKKIRTTKGDSPYVRSWIDDLYEKISPYFQWTNNKPDNGMLTMGKIFGDHNAFNVYKNKERREGNCLKADIKKMFFRYITGGKDYEFDNIDGLSRQLVQDIKLKLLGLNKIIGIKHQDGQFSKKANDDDAATGRNKPLRIYRTMPAKDWDGSLESVLKGHGGSLGQALHYFRISRDNFVPKEKTPKYDNVLVVLKFEKNADALIDYEKIVGGKEGGGPTQDGKLTGKSEKNDIFGRDEEIFSINLSKSKARILKIKPTAKLIDRVSDYKKSSVGDSI